jgi:hypothetical protein
MYDNGNARTVMERRPHCDAKASDCNGNTKVTEVTATLSVMETQK